MAARPAFRGVWCFVLCFYISIPVVRCSCRVTEAEGEVGYPLNWFKPPPAQYFNTDRSRAVLLLWFLTATSSCCPYLYFGSPIM